MKKNHVIALVAAAVVLLVVYYFLVLQPGNGPLATPTPVPTPSAAPLVAKAGDIVHVDYTVRTENGSVYDTSIESVARAAGIYKPNVIYRPFNFTIGNGDVIDGFDAAVTGMAAGEEKTAIIPPEKAYGAYQPTLLSALPRFYTVPRIENVSKADFLEMFPGFNFTENQTVDFETWNATILAISNASIMLRHDPTVNQTIPTQNWPETVVNVTDAQIVLRRDPTLNAMYYAPDAGGNIGIATARQISDDFIMLDYNPPLAGHTLNFTIKLLSIG